MLVLLLVRHGLSGNNVLEEKLKVELGDNYKERYQAEKNWDPECAEQGHKEAELVAGEMREILSHLPEKYHKLPIRLCSSTMNRALQTAEPIAKELGLPIDVIPDIHEYGGCWTSHVGGQPGATPAEIEARYPGTKVDPAVPSTGWWSKTERETQDEADGRAERVAARLHRRAQEEPDEVLIMVTHGNWMQRLLRVLVCGNVSANLGFFHQNTATTALTIPSKEGGKIELLWFNKSEHLEKLENSKAARIISLIGQESC